MRYNILCQTQWFGVSLHCINTLLADFISKVNYLLNFLQAAILYYIFN
jgi:hypothetical protein